MCNLNASARWAVTGTPIQNKVGDLAALLKFIKAYPYDDAKQFELDIGQLWKTEKTEEAIIRLRKLSRALILRRPKTVISLPLRSDLTFSIDFSAQERELYSQLKSQTLAEIEEAANDGDRGSVVSNSYITVMQRINALRMICDMGLNYHSRHDLGIPEKKNDLGPNNWAAVAQETFNLQREMTSIHCERCACPCDTAVPSQNHLLAENTPPSFFAKCFSYICSDCAQVILQHQHVVVCGHTPGHATAPVSLSWTAIEETGLSTGAGNFAQGGVLSSKVAALIGQLKRLPSDTKR